jgi:hypothetical protein
VPTIHQASGVDFEKPFSVLCNEENGVLRWTPGTLVTGAVAEVCLGGRAGGAAIASAKGLKVASLASDAPGAHRYRQDTEDAHAPRMWTAKVKGIGVLFGPVAEHAIPASLLAQFDLCGPEAGEYAEFRYRPAPPVINNLLTTQG